MKSIRRMATLIAVCAISTADVWAQQASGLVPAPLPSSETTLKDQTDVSVTVYNNNLALVRDRRKLALESGEQKLAFMDVAQQIQPQTVSLRSVSSPGSIQILEQNYEFDLMSPSKMMEKYVGKEVNLVNFSTEIGFEQVTAELMSLNEGPIYKVNNQIYLGHPGTVVLPEVPENLIAKPSLIWLLENTVKDQDVEVSYLTNGIAWTADYVVTLQRDEKSIDLDGWVTLNNQSGTQYTNANLKLVAGEVNVVTQIPAVQEKMMMVRRGVAAAPPPMQEEAFAEYHLYTLPRRTTIKENQSKQVSLLGAVGIQVKKVYEYRGEQYFFFQKMEPLKEQHVAAMLKFKNAESNKLGMPLPGGVMRVYQEDSSGALQFSGEDRIQHTPKDEEVTLKLGNAFDVVAERTQTDFKIIATNVFESAYEIKVRNHKDADISVDIIEQMTSDWTIREKSHDFKKRDAFTAVFTVPVAKDGETVVTYRVQVRQ